MARTRICRQAPFRRTLIAMVVALTECTVGAAHGGGSWHWQDQVAISGSPAATVTAGQVYSFTPSASDRWGRTLVFAIANKPSWATFSSSTG